jgi:hypothetical protein
MKKILVVLSTIFLAACGGGGGGAEAPAPVVPPAPAPLTITLNDSSHSTDEDNAVTANFDVSTNRSATLSYSASDEPDYGSVSFSGNSFTYTPNDNFFGSDEFEVTASAESASDSAKISLTINSVNDVPVLEVSLVETDGSDYPLQFVTDALPINITASDVETSDLDVSASATFAGSTEQVSLSVDLQDQSLDLTNLANSGPMDVNFLVSDGEASVSASINFWRSKPITNDATVDELYNLYGNSEDTDRGFRYAIFLDNMPSEEVVATAQDTFKFFFSDFLASPNAKVQELIDNYFNVVIIESPLNSSAINVTTGEDVPECNGEGSDPRTYCIYDIKPAAIAYVDAIFGEGYFDNYSVITSKEGRGVNLGNLNIQPLLSAVDGVNDEGTNYLYGPNRMLKTLKHEFGHGYQFLGDHYTSDFTREDDDGNPFYPESKWTNKRQFTETSPDITYVQEPLESKWVHKFKSTSTIPGRDDQSDQSNEAVGWWSGCYSHDEVCYRSSYNSIMNGDYSNSGDWYLDGIRSDALDWDPVAAEGFELRTLAEQGLHLIDASLGSNNETVTVSTQLNVNESIYEIRWYINGVLQESNTNEKSITVSKTTGYTSIAYRVFDLREEPIITVTDDVDQFGDVYLGAYGARTGRYYCALLPNVWEGITNRLCDSTFYAVYEGDLIYTSPNIASSNADLESYSYFKYWYEYSGLGSQFVINWTYF